MKLTREEITNAVGEYYISEDSLAKHQRAADIMDALAMQDPINKKLTNPAPDSNLGTEMITEYFTIFETTIKGKDRDALISKLMEILTGDF